MNVHLGRQGSEGPMESIWKVRATQRVKVLKTTVLLIIMLPQSLHTSAMLGKSRHHP